MEATHTDSPLLTNTTTIGVAVVVFLSICFFLNKKPKHKGILPPGPKPVPLFGNLLDVQRSDKHGLGIFDKWAEEFGAICSIRFGSYDGVVLNSADVIKEVFVKHGVSSAGRPSNVFFNRMVIGIHGIVASEGQPWKSTRRTAVHSLRDFGMGKKSLEFRIQEEASAMVNVIEQKADMPFDPRLALHNATSNVICSIVFGQRYDYDDPDFLTLSEYLTLLFSQGGFKNPILYIPILTPFIPLNKTFFKAVRIVNYLRNYIRKITRQHKENFDPDDIKSFIDIYLKAEKEGELDNKDFEQNILACIFDLFTAGSETSLTTLRWALLYLVNNPDVQAKCQEHIVKEIGQERAPNNADRARLPYVEATLYEIQRISNIAAYGVMHRAMEDIEVYGYTIPKDHLIMSNIHHVHMDPEYWGDPKVFRPERWLGQDGQLIKHENFLPFSTGPRECPGKSLALQEMFIMLVSLLQKFTFKAVDPRNPPGFSGCMGVTHVPNDYEIIASKY